MWFAVSFIEQSFSALLESVSRNSTNFKASPGFDKVVVKFEVPFHKENIFLLLVLELSA